MKKILTYLLAVMMSLGLTACGGSDVPAASESGLSGKVTVYMPSPAGLADEIAAGFTAATGVEVEVFQGTTGEILARLEAEEANPVADVVILASWTDGLSMKNDGKIQVLKVIKKICTSPVFITYIVLILLSKYSKSL